MRSDLRKLLSRHRFGLIRPAALDEAVDEACSLLVTDRFRLDGSLSGSSRFTQPLLVRFEDRIDRARLRILEGERHRAVEAVEAAETALAQAQKIAEAEREWQEVRTIWRELAEAFGLNAFPELATVRVAERSLEIARGFLEARKARKARLVVGQLRVGFERLTLPGEDQARRSELVRLLMRRHRSGAVEELASTVGRLADAGLLELAQRLVEDWEVLDEEAGSTQRRKLGRFAAPSAKRSALPLASTRFGEIARDASRLAPVLEEIAAAGGPTAGDATATGTNTEVE